MADTAAAPPAYDAVEGQAVDEQSLAQLQANLHNLDLNSEAAASALKPTADTCLAHLKLLGAFEELKTRTGHQDGLWQISNWRASGGNPDVLAVLCEKRWAVYVARAVDRYQAWWDSFVPDMLTEGDMIASNAGPRPEQYAAFTGASEPMRWTAETLLPLGMSDPPCFGPDHWRGKEKGVVLVLVLTW
jgi:hypothetical protein